MSAPRAAAQLKALVEDWTSCSIVRCGVAGHDPQSSQCSLEILSGDRLPHRARAGCGQFLPGLKQFLHLLMNQCAKLMIGFLFGRSVTNSAPRKQIRAIAHIGIVSLFPPNKLEIL